MAHPIYSSQQLLNRGMIKVKEVASDLGVLPTGDKRLIQNWIDAIIEHQSAQVQKIEIVEAVIVFDDGLATCELAKYHVIVGGEIVHSVIAYAAAEGWVTRKGYTLVDSQTLAQQELKVELEVQATARAEKAKSVEVLEQVEDEGFVKFIVQNNDNIYTVTPAHPIPKERCECGDNHFRGAECKHQLAVKNAIASRISFISPTDFGYYEAIVDNDIHHVIAKIEYLDQSWNVEMVNKFLALSSYEKAEQFIKDEYVNNVIMHSATGRIEPVIEDMMNMNIENSNFVHDFG